MGDSDGQALEVVFKLDETWSRSVGRLTTQAARLSAAAGANLKVHAFLHLKMSEDAK
jgi:hypothetical protein